MHGGGDGQIDMGEQAGGGPADDLPGIQAGAECWLRVLQKE